MYCATVKPENCAMNMFFVLHFSLKYPRELSNLKELYISKMFKLKVFLNHSVANCKIVKYTLFKKKLKHDKNFAVFLVHTLHLNILYVIPRL